MYLAIRYDAAGNRTPIDDRDLVDDLGRALVLAEDWQRDCDGDGDGEQIRLFQLVLVEG